MNTKFCKDCKFHSPDYRNYWCEHPTHGIYPDNGKPRVVMCNTLRREGGACGLDAKLYLPKPLPQITFYQRILNFFSRAKPT